MHWVFPVSTTVSPPLLNKRTSHDLVTPLGGTIPVFKYDRMMSASLSATLPSPSTSKYGGGSCPGPVGTGRGPIPEELIRLIMGSVSFGAITPSLFTSRGFAGFCHGLPQAVTTVPTGTRLLGVRTIKGAGAGGDSVLSRGPVQSASSWPVTRKSIRPSLSLSKPSSHWIVPISSGSVDDEHPGSLFAPGPKSTVPSLSLSIPSTHCPAAIIPVHVRLHFPGWPFSAPSSHASTIPSPFGCWRVPSPHVVSVQILEQVSALDVLPSSHCSAD